MNTQPNTTLRILQLLLRCGMIGQEELKVVLEIMAAAAATQAVSRSDEPSKGESPWLF